LTEEIYYAMTMKKVSDSHIAGMVGFAIVATISIE
jgi:hypothetical protein